MATLTNVKMNLKEINSTVVLNILRMLKRREMIKNTDKLYSELEDSISADQGIDFSEEGKKFSIYIINGKLTSITSKSPLDDYLNKNLSTKKFVIIRDASKKTIKQVLKDYENSEFFFEHEMLEDIPSKLFIPEHKIMSKEDKEEFLKKFKRENLSQIKSTDMMVRYYNGKVGDIVKITRPNITSGYSIFYRVVVKGTVDFLF